MTESDWHTVLLQEYQAAQAYSLALVHDLDPSDVDWRPNENSSSMAWHLGHQAAVNHFMVRNLTAAEPSFNKQFDAMFDSATPEHDRRDLPHLEDIASYRAKIADSTNRIVDKIASGEVGAPEQLALIAQAMMQSIINHEYQHAKWIAEVRATMTDLPETEPASSRLRNVEGYYML